jgi:predicted dienelactone hydrolase
MSGPDRPGPFNAGFREATLRDPTSGATTPILFWYPTAAPERQVRRGPFQDQVAPDAPPADGPFPAVVLSHGAGGSSDGHRDTASFLARNGLVVAGPYHAGNNFQDNSAEGTVALFHSRPREIGAAIDNMLAQPWLAGRIDPDRIGAMGFSAGGYSVLVAAGGIARLHLIGEHCRAHPDDCIPGIEHPSKDDPSAVVSLPPDRRIRAAVLMATPGTMFGEHDLERVEIPIRLYRAEKDEVVRSPWHVERVRSLLPRAPEYVVVEGGGHFAFLSPFPQALVSAVGAPAQDPPGFDRVRYLATLDAEVHQFFARHLAVR